MTVKENLLDAVRELTPGQITWLENTVRVFRFPPQLQNSSGMSVFGGTPQTLIWPGWAAPAAGQLPYSYRIGGYAQAWDQSGAERRRNNLDLPNWMIASLDQEAKHVGVTRQSIMKVWMSERIKAEQVGTGQPM